jgi:two-component system chemotaxis response regulator CheB
MKLISRHLKELFTHIRKNTPKEPDVESFRSAPNQRPEGADLVLIASSTGGPSALERIITKFSASFPKPVLVVQHMPPDFTRIFAESLNKKSKVKVVEAAPGSVILPGTVYIAPGGFHMKIEKTAVSKFQVQLDQTEFVCGVRPSADVLFSSVAASCEKKNILVAVLTGMGRDGTAGLAELKKKTNCYCITQSENSCVVYGMPRSVLESGLSDAVSDIDEIAELIETIVLQE